jgi:hypothetical protein
MAAGGRSDEEDSKRSEGGTHEASLSPRRDAVE